MSFNIKKTTNNSKASFSLVGIYIVSAVRTPIGIRNGVLSKLSALQLGSLAFREALQRALVPGKVLQNLFLSCDINSTPTEEVINRTGLPKSANVSPTSLFGMKSFVEAIRFLLMGNKTVCLAGGANSTSNLPSVVNKAHQENIKSLQKDNFLDLMNLKNYIEQDYKNFFEACKKGAFLDEIIKICFIKEGQQIVTDEDEVATFQHPSGNLWSRQYPAPLGDGAVALIISTEDFINNNNLTPLAQIISFSEESAKGNNIASVQYLAIEKALKMAGCQPYEIKRWEIDSVFGTVSDCIHHFKIDSSLVNKDGGVFSLGYAVGMSGMKAVCHLTHSLNVGELGCAATCDFHGSASAVVIRKLSRRTTGKPELTLYTKSPCPLCDELKTGLKPFEGRFNLKEVDIETEENKDYEDLFKYEIPVLFLDGKFLCKHKLNEKLLNQRLLDCESVT